MFIIGVFECDVVQLFGLYPGGLLCVDVVVEPGLVLGVPLGDPVPHYQLVVGWWGGGGAGGLVHWLGVGGLLQVAGDGGGDVHRV